jgi:hypothetical protein
MGQTRSSVPQAIVRGRIVALALLAAAGIAVMAPHTFGDFPLGCAVRIALASALIGLIPGALTALAWYPGAVVDILWLAALALAISFGFSQLLTIMALIGHWSAPVSLGVLGAFVCVAATRAAYRDRCAVRIDWRHALPLAGIAVIAVYLYAAGSPYAAFEDRIHVAISERLAHLHSPSIRNIYFAPNVVYTYPFPGTHYMVALIARAADLPVIFVYAKLRAFWGVAALILLYGFASAVFMDARIAVASTLTALALVANGSFGGVRGLYWGQLAPYSHASDVAMGVLLPALLFAAVHIVSSKERRERLFLVAVTLPLILMLVIVHPREIVQFIVYLTSFALLLMCARNARPMLRPTIGLVAVTIALLVGYRLVGVATIDQLVTSRRAVIGGVLANASWAQLIGQPYPFLRDYMASFDVFFYGWNPVLLLVSPLILLAMRRKTLAWLIAAGIASYILIVRYPLLAIPYAYLTYFEILYTPVRNVTFFLHVLAGVGLYLIAAVLARLPAWLLIPAATAAGLSIVAMGQRLGETAETRLDVLFVPVLIGYAVWFAMTMAHRGEGKDNPIAPPRARWALAFAIVLSIVVYGSRVPTSATVVGPLRDNVPTPTALLRTLPCTDNGNVCPPPASLIRFAHERLSADAVVAVDLREQYPPAMFIPQQMTIWPGGTGSLIDAAQLFPKYYAHLKRVEMEGRDQPLLDPGESAPEGRTFLKDLDVGYVLLNPRLYSTMKPMFAGNADLFTTRYDDGQWALYEVNRDGLLR